MARRPHEKLPTDPAQLEGLTKAAILLLTLDSTQAATVLKQMSAEGVEEVTRELAGLGRVPLELQRAVVEEFYSTALAMQSASEGNLDHAKNLLKDALDPATAAKVMQQIQTQVQRTPFSFLQRAESENLLTFIQDEHPQTIALIVCHLPHHKASEILTGLPAQKQVEVVKRIANMDQTNPQVIRDVEKGLETRLSNVLSQSSEKMGGISTVAEVLNLADRATEKSIMEGL
ncbi:MAG: flagellar motor switch protein FliG, partial [Phycisphaerales bacterium JB061]